MAAAIKEICRNSIKKEHEQYKDGEEGKGDVKKIDGRRTQFADKGDNRYRQ